MDWAVLTGSYLLGGLGGAKEDGDEGQPDDAGCVHGETDGLRLIKRLWNTSTLHCVHRTCYLATENQHLLSDAAERTGVT